MTSSVSVGLRPLCSSMSGLPRPSVIASAAAAAAEAAAAVGVPAGSSASSVHSERASAREISARSGCSEEGRAACEQYQ
jgi:hypothetical protein